MVRNFRLGPNLDEKLLEDRPSENIAREGNEFLSGEKILLFNKKKYLLKESSLLLKAGGWCLIGTLVCILAICLFPDYYPEVFTNTGTALYAFGSLLILVAARDISSVQKKSEEDGQKFYDKHPHKN